MRIKLLTHNVFVTCVALFVLASCSNRISSKNEASSSPASTSILFIGNSYTYFNNGIDHQLKSLAPSSNTSSVALGGYTLEKHWNDENTLETLRKGGWKYVVLQEQSQTPIFDQTLFREFAGKFDREIRSNGAKTILLMTWERPDSVNYGVTTANLAAAYNAVGTELGAKVAPVGLAFDRSLRERPDLLLYNQDGHPTIYGTYLAACVLYGTVFEQSPVGRPDSDASIPMEIRVYFQRIAAESLGY